MNDFITIIAMELYNKIVEITCDELDYEQYEAIKEVIVLSCRIIFRYCLFQNKLLIDDLKLLKEKMEKEEKK